MANIKSAKKRALQSERHRQHNIGLKSTYRTLIKKIEAAINGNQPEEAMKLLKAAIPTMDKMATKGIVHKNKAARHKNRLNSKIKKLK